MTTTPSSGDARTPDVPPKTKNDIMPSRPNPVSGSGLRARLFKAPYWFFGLVLIWIVVSIQIARSDEYSRIFEELSEGVSLTLGIALSAYLLALVIGLVTGIIRSQSPRPPTAATFRSDPGDYISRIIYVCIYNITSFYVETMRGIPPLVFLLITGFIIVPAVRDPVQDFFNATLIPLLNSSIIPMLNATISTLFRSPLDVGLPFLEQIGAQIPRYWFLDYEPFSDMVWRGRDAGTAILGLGVIYGAFLAEVFRAGIQSVPKGQVEAAQSLGMSYLQTMRHIIIPQAVRNVLPPLGNDFISMIKDTSLATILGTNEITQLARKWSGSTFQYLETYLVLSLIYLTLTVSGSMIVQAMERYLGQYNKN